MFFRHHPSQAEVLFSMLGLKALDIALLAIIFLWLRVIGASDYVRVVGTSVFSLAITFVFTRIVKEYVHRERPHTSLNINPLISSSDPYSFPSDHTAACFCAATCVSSFYPRLAPITLVIALLVSLSRFVDRLHYPSDIIVGSLLGSLVGLVCAILGKALLL